jgi:hypothetical protein
VLAVRYHQTLAAGPQGGAIAEGQGDHVALRQRQGLEALQGLSLQVDLLAPLQGEVVEAVELEAQPLHRQGPQQADGGDVLARLQQPPQRGLQHRRGAAAVGGGEQVTEAGQHLAARPAVEQLLAEAGVPQQGGAQQDLEILATAGLEQVQPDRQIPPGARASARAPGPAMKLVQVHRQLQAIETELQHLRGTGRRRQARHRDQQTGQQALELAKAA